MEAEVFPCKDDLVLHIYKRLDNPTTLKVQKSLYFLWAYYSSSYGNIDKSEETDLSQATYPTSLFKPDFEALKYGPVDTEVLAKQRNGYYSENKWKEHPAKTVEELEVITYINNLLGDIDDISDFGLIALAQKDKAWQNAYKTSTKKMSASKIRQEYRYREGLY